MARNVKLQSGDIQIGAVEIKDATGSTRATVGANGLHVDVQASSGIGSLTEAAPATDTASSGVNGRLQRIAQRLTSLIALVPAALTGSGNFKVAVQEALPAGTNAIGKLAANAGVDIGDVGAKSYALAGAGELAGSASAVQMPTLTCKMVKFKAAYDNAGRVYIGGSGVTVKDGTTDTTTGIELSAGEETGWLPVANVNAFYRICNNAGDDLTFIALV